MPEQQTRYRMNKLMRITEIDAFSTQIAVGSKAGYFKLLDGFIWSAPQLCAELFQTKNHQDAELFQKQIFTLQKLLLSVGAVDLLVAAEKTVDHVRKGDWNSCEEKIPSLISRIYMLCEGILGAQISPSDTSTGDTVVIEKTQLDGMDGGAWKKILAIDDMPDFLAGLKSLLMDQYAVYGATDHVTALKILANEHPDLILLDIDMPDMSGFEMLELIRKIKVFATTPILFVTGCVTVENIVRSRQAGGNDFLMKPVDPDVLRFKIKKHLEHPQP